MRPASHYVGRWLRVTTRPDVGFGYCKGVRGGKYVLNFVDVPEAIEHELVVDADDLLDKPLPVGTRVWVRGMPYGWHAGVVEREASGRRYHVALVGMVQRYLLYQDQFFVRWSRPLEDPSIAISHGLTDSPVFYEARSALLRELVQQRRVSRGLTAAISAPINLFQHQIDTAARVLADPVMRYLLADEVGLGKTIEAGIVIRQLLIEDPGARALVLCPESLKGQWKSELRDRLGLGDALQGAPLTVASHGSLQYLAASQPGGLGYYQLIVIDEAHNLFKHLDSGLDLEQHFRYVDGLLALSATPMRGDLETFRRLLALVDPVAFGDTDSASFGARIDERERSAGDVQVLSARRASLRQKATVLDSIESDFPDDEAVRALACACKESNDPQAPAWTELAEYVREIYRISRRMIRHRRTSELTDSYAVAGRIPTFIALDDPGRSVVDEFLESYRLRLYDAASPDDFAMTVLHALAGPMALRDHLKRRLTEDDRALFEMTVARLEMAGVEHRLKAAAEVTHDRVRNGRRVIVVSSFPAVLERFEGMIKDKVDDYKIHHHYHSLAPEDRDSAVADFLGNFEGGLLLADSSMEEGRNLQEAEVLINLDLPLDANRLDQRIGRLDRYAVRPESAEVIVFTEPSSEWVSAHIDLLDHGIGVLHSSVSTVQRLLSAVLDAIRNSLINKGVEALQVDVASLRDELETERDHIDLLEELESVEAATVFNEEAFDELLQYETDPDSLRRAIRRLTTGTGSLSLKPSESPAGVLQFGNARAIGLSTDETLTLERLLRPKAFDRAVTLEHQGVSPFRIGDPLVDWLEDYLIADERGLASALVRPVRDLASPALWLHCEFLIQFDAEQPAVADGPDRRRLSRRGAAHLQPMRLETWTDSSGSAPADLVADVLNLPFDERRDEVLRGKTWVPVLGELPSWSQLCKESAEAAWEDIRGSAERDTALRLALESAERDTVRRIAILEARALRLPSGAERRAANLELELERRTAQALADGIRNPSMRMVACGACVLWPEENF